MKNMVLKLKRLMYEKGMTCSELSKRTGIANTTLAALINGKTDKIDIVKVRKICEVFGCSMDYLVNDDIWNEKDVTNIIDDNTFELINASENNDHIIAIIDKLIRLNADDIKLIYNIIIRLSK